MVTEIFDGTSKKGLVILCNCQFRRNSNWFPLRIGAIFHVCRTKVFVSSRFLACIKYWCDFRRTWNFTYPENLWHIHYFWHLQPDKNICFILHAGYFFFFSSHGNRIRCCSTADSQFLKVSKFQMQIFLLSF